MFAMPRPDASAAVLIPDREVLTAWGSREKQMYGKTVQIRPPFVVDEDGKIVVTQYNVAGRLGHVAKLRRDLSV